MQTWDDMSNQYESMFQLQRDQVIKGRLENGPAL